MLMEKNQFYRMDIYKKGISWRWFCLMIEIAGKTKVYRGSRGWDDVCDWWKFLRIKWENWWIYNRNCMCATIWIV